MATRGKQIVQIREKTIVDQQTGEIIATESDQSYRLKGGEPQFIKLYLDCVMQLSDLDKSSSGLVMALLKYVSYGTNEIFLNPVNRQRICEELGYAKIQSLNNALDKLKKKGILIGAGRGTFILNPFIFGKGEWKDISKIRMNIEFSTSGVFVNTKIQTGENLEDEKTDFVELIDFEADENELIAHAKPTKLEEESACTSIKWSLIYGLKFRP